MKTKALYLLSLGVSGVLSVSQAAIITVTTADNVSPPPGTVSLLQALNTVQDGDEIRFNIPGPGPHYIVTPPGGYPYITRNNVTIDGYSQPGSSPNSNPILAPNNAQIRIVLDSRAGGYKSMNFEPGNPNSGYGATEVAVLGIVGANNVKIRGLGILLSPSPAEARYAIAFARGASGGQVSGCWIGVDVDGTSVYGAAAGVAGFRYRRADGTGTLTIDGTTVGVAAGSANAPADFNVIVGMGIPVILEGNSTRIAGNFLGVLPDGLHDYNVGMARPGESEGAIQIGRGCNNTVIGTDGDGVNDANERNVIGGTMLSTEGGYPHTIEFYGCDPGTNIVVAGNYIGVGVDGATWFTNAASPLNAAGAAAQYRFGSDFDGVSDALEANLVHNYWPLERFPAYDLGLESESLNFHSELQVSGSVLLRGNALINNFPFPASPLRLNGEFLPAYYAKVLVDVGAGIEPSLSADSTSSLLRGYVPVAKAEYPYTVVDVYVADPVGITNGLRTGWPELPNGWVQGAVHLGAFQENGPEDLNPTPGAFEFDLTKCRLTGGYKVTVTATYLKDPPGTRNARGITSPFSAPLELGRFRPTSAQGVGSSYLVPDRIIFDTPRANLDNWEPYISLMGQTVFLIEANTFVEPVELGLQRYGLVFQPVAGGLCVTGDVFYADNGTPYRGQINASRQNGNPGRVAGDPRPGAQHFIAGGEASPYVYPAFQSDSRWATYPARYGDNARFGAVQIHRLDPVSLVQQPTTLVFDAIAGRITDLVPAVKPEVSRFGGDLIGLDDGNFVVVVDDRSNFFAPTRSTTAVIVSPTGQIIKETFVVDTQDIWANVAAFRGGFCVRVHSMLYFFDNAGNRLGQLSQALSGISFDTGRGDGTRIAGNINSPYVYLAGAATAPGSPNAVRLAVFDSRGPSFVTATNVSELSAANGGGDYADYLPAQFERVNLAVDALDRVAVAYEVKEENTAYRQQTVMRVLAFDPTLRILRYVTPSFYPFINHGPYGPAGVGFGTFRPSVAMTTRQICLAAKGEINSQNRPELGPDTKPQTTFYVVLSHPDPQPDPRTPAVQLAVRREGNNLVLSWPVTAAQFTLQATSTLSPPAWTDVQPAPPIVIVDGQNTVTLPIGSGNRFFRLRL